MNRLTHTPCTFRFSLNLERRLGGHVRLVIEALKNAGFTDAGLARNLEGFRALYWGVKIPTG